MNAREDSDADASLAARLRARIRSEGAISFHDWMQAALYDEREGFYRRRDRLRWGRAGDYRTSPERSRLFGATFARYFAALDEELGHPPALHILEVGGGAAHFARPLLETLRRDWPELFSRVRYIFEETSADARERAAGKLSEFASRLELVSAYEAEAPLAAGIIFSNELLDAFAVHRVAWRGGALREMFVGLDEHDRFVWVEGEPATGRLAAHFEREHVSLAEAQVAEVNLAAEEWIERAAGLIERGFVVTVDYGDEADSLYGAPHRREGTLRAFSAHALAADPLARPGEQDLTTTIDWTQIRRAGERAGLQTVLLERQSAFLLRAGFLNQLERETALARDEAEVMSLRLETREMILPGGMSDSFQVLVQKKMRRRS